MKKKIVVIYSTHLSHEEDSLFEERVKRTIGSHKYKLKRYENKREYSLPELYNRALSEIEDKESTIAVFVHNDVLFNTKNWGNRLLMHFNDRNNDYQIIGIAGTDTIEENGVWWLDETNQMKTKGMYGIVNHDNGLEEYTSTYSQEFRGVKPVVAIDGLFMAVDPFNIEEEFDLRFGMFHYYDIPFCISNYLAGCNIGVVTDIRVTHLSIGQVNGEWELNRLMFVNHFKDDLPLKLEN